MLSRVIKAIQTRRNEEGVSLIELMVSFMIIVAVLTASALAITAANKTQTFAEARDKANSIANGMIATAHQMTFKSLAYPQSIATADVIDNGFGNVTKYGLEDIIIVPDSELNYDPTNSNIEDQIFLPYREVDQGENHYQITTYLTKVKLNTSFDASGNIMNATAAAPRRITVIITWDAGDGQKGEVVRSWVRVPTTAECIPKRLDTTPNPNDIPLECRA